MVTQGLAGTSNHISWLPGQTLTIHISGSQLRAILSPKDTWQSLETLHRNWRCCSISYNAQDSPAPSKKNNRPQVTMLPQCETSFYTMVSLRKGIPGPPVHCLDWKGQEMRNQQICARVQVVKVVTLSKLHLPEPHFTICKTEITQIILHGVSTRTWLDIVLCSVIDTW